MKYFYFLWISCLSFAQIPSYYNGVDFTASPESLMSQLSDLITSTHTNITIYDQTWSILQQTDVDPNDTSKVFLIYGYDNFDNEVINDLTRNIDDYGGSNGQWNREHVYPKSLGNPNLGTEGPGADPHMLRASDVQKNAQRANLPFTYGSGIASGVQGQGFYPGEEWRGDVARIIMYMYLRYGDQCLPNSVAIGSSNSYSPEMPDIFLTWNYEDPISPVEIQRNNVLNSILGNRNPFIDNPYLATLIWGGPSANDTWNLSVEDIDSQENRLSLSPNPAQDFITISDEFELAEIYNLDGKLLKQSKESEISVQDLQPAVYLIKITALNGEKKILKFIKN